MVIVKEPSCDSAKVTNTVTSVVQEGKKVTDVGAELSYVLPSSSSQHFPRLFDTLEGMMSYIGGILTSNYVTHHRSVFKVHMYNFMFSYILDIVMTLCVYTAHKTELGIAGFGISVTTMEEVFIKVGEGTDETLEQWYVFINNTGHPTFLGYYSLS